MRTVTWIQALLGLALLGAIPVGARGAAAAVTALQILGGVGLLAAALGSRRTAPECEVDLWGWVAIAMAAWTFVACFAAGLDARYTLFAVDLVVGLASSGLASWAVLRPQPWPARQPGSAG
jgi:hypothetical protein